MNNFLPRCRAFAARWKLLRNLNTPATPAPRADLNSQVTDLLASAGVTGPAQVASMVPEPVQWPVDNGFTTSADRLADCLSWLMPPGTSTVLIVDRGNFEGDAAGVIVSNTADGVQVWVIDPQCPHVQAGVMDHQPYRWQE